MSKKLGGVIALMGLCALSLFLLNCGSSSSRPSGVLYVLTQGSNGVGDNVTSYAIDLNSGNLSLVNSNATTCLTAAGTCGLPVNILLDPTGAVAFVLNQGAPPCPSCTPPTTGAPTIYSYPVNSDGSLGTPTAAMTPTLIPGDTAIAMTRDAGGNFLYVITEGNQSSNPPLAPQLLVFSTKPGSTSLTPVSNVLSTLTKIPTALSTITFPVPNGVTAPCGFTTTEEYVFVTFSHDLSSEHNDNALSIHCVDSSGTLSDLTPDPPYTPAADPLSVLAVNTNQAGQNGGGVFIYVGSQPSASGALSTFQMCTQVGIAGCVQQDVTAALLKPVGTSPTSTGQNPVAMAVDPTNSFLYVVCYIQNAVYGYSISTAGALTPLSTPYQQTGLQPVALALHPSVNNTGQFLYTSNSGQNNISGFALSTTNGSMSSLPTVVTPAAPSGMAVH